MSDKLLKDGLRTSDKIGGVSVFAELLFVRLLIATCPLGRCPWSPDWILVHALSNRPSTRLATITAALEELRACHLVTRYTHDDDAYLMIPNHGQRFKHAVRSPWPAPPGGPPDVEGQTFMAWSGPAPRAPVSGKKPKVVCESPPTHFSSKSSSERDLRPASECLPELVARYPRHDVPACLRAATRYARKQRGDDAEVSVGWFIASWMPGAAERKQPATAALAAPTPATLTAEQARWQAEQAAKLAALIHGPEPAPGSLDHAIWLEGAAQRQAATTAA